MITWGYDGTVIYYFKGIGQVKTYLENTLASEIAIPAIVLFELYVELAKSISENSSLPASAQLHR